MLRAEDLLPVGVVFVQTWLQGDQKMNNGGNQDGFSCKWPMAPSFTPLTPHTHTPQNTTHMESNA